MFAWHQFEGNLVNTNYHHQQDPIKVEVDPITKQIAEIITPGGFRYLVDWVGLGNSTTEKVKAVWEILADNPWWTPDDSWTIFTILRFSGDISDKELRTRIERRACCKSVDGVVSIARKYLSQGMYNVFVGECKNRLVKGTLFIDDRSQFKNNLWSFIKNHEVKELVIEGRSFEGYALSLLVEIQPPLHELVEYFKIHSTSGRSIQKPIAILRLCGDFFRAIIDSDYIEALNRSITFNDFDFDRFLWILDILEPQGMDFRVDAKTFHEAIEYFQFKYIGVYGSKEWEIWGKSEPEIYSRELMMYMNSPCPFNKKKLVRDTHVVVWIPHTVNGEILNCRLMEKFSKITYAKNIQDLSFENPLPQKGYFAVMYAMSPLEKSEKLSPYGVKEFVKCYGYDLPDLREAMICTLLPYASSKRNIIPESTLIYTKDHIYDCGSRRELCIKNLSPAGFEVGTATGDYWEGKKGVLPIKRFGYTPLIPEFQKWIP